MKVTVKNSEGQEVVIDDLALEPFREQLTGIPTAPRKRLAYAAAHIVMQPGYAEVNHSVAFPGGPGEIAERIDWAGTMAIRRRLDALGFGVAEAMDTAQRFAIGWKAAERLIRECGALQLDNGFIAGAGADQLDHVSSTADLIDAVVQQANIIQEAGGIVMLLPLPWLSRSGLAGEAYVEVYAAIIRQLAGPLCVHWLGEAFLPDLSGYFPGDSFARIMALDPEKVKACKLSLLDADRERRIRRELLPRDQFVLTGDDFNFAELMLGDDKTDRTTTFGDHQVGLGDFSHALLGILGGIAEPASLALQLLDQGNRPAYRSIMQPCEALGRWIFQEPTPHYKAGLAFISWLNGWQDVFILANHEEGARDAAHYFRVAQLAAAAGALTDVATAAERLETWLQA